MKHHWGCILLGLHRLPSLVTVQPVIMQRAARAPPPCLSWPEIYYWKWLWNPSPPYSWLSSLALTDGGHSHQQIHDTRNSRASFNKPLGSTAAWQVVLLFDIVWDTHAWSSWQPQLFVSKVLLLNFSEMANLYSFIVPLLQSSSSFLLKLKE